MPQPQLPSSLRWDDEPQPILPSSLKWDDEQQPQQPEEPLWKKIATPANAAAFGFSAAGDALGAMFPPAYPALSFGGGFIGEGLRQVLAGDPISFPGMVFEGGANLVPGPKIPGAGAGLKQLAKYGAKSAVSGVGQGLIGTFPRHQIAQGNLLNPSEWEMPSAGEFGEQAAAGGITSGIVGTAMGGGNILRQNRLQSIANANVPPPAAPTQPIGPTNPPAPPGQVYPQLYPQGTPLEKLPFTLRVQNPKDTAFVEFQRQRGYVDGPLNPDGSMTMTRQDTVGQPPAPQPTQSVPQVGGGTLGEAKAAADAAQPAPTPTPAPPALIKATPRITIASPNAQTRARLERQGYKLVGKDPQGKVFTYERQDRSLMERFIDEDEGSFDPEEMWGNVKRLFTDRPERQPLHGDEQIPDLAFQPDEGVASSREWAENFLPGPGVSNPTNRADINQETRLAPEGRMNEIVTSYPSILEEAKLIYNETDPQIISENLARYSAEEREIWTRFNEAQSNRIKYNIPVLPELQAAYNRIFRLKDLAQAKYERASVRQLEGKPETVADMIGRFWTEDKGTFDPQQMWENLKRFLRRDPTPDELNAAMARQVKSGETTGRVAPFEGRIRPEGAPRPEDVTSPYDDPNYVEPPSQTDRVQSIVDGIDAETDPVKLSGYIEQLRAKLNEFYISKNSNASQLFKSLIELAETRHAELTSGRTITGDQIGTDSLPPPRQPGEYPPFGPEGIAIPGFDKPVMGQQGLPVGPQGELRPRELESDTWPRPTELDVPTEGGLDVAPFRQSSLFSRFFTEDQGATPLSNWGDAFRRMGQAGEEYIPTGGTPPPPTPPIQPPPPPTPPPPPVQPPTGPTTPPEKKVSRGREWYNLPRGLTTPLDLSASMRQGLPLITRKEWWTSWKQQIQAMGSDGAFKKTLADIEDKPEFTRMLDPLTGKLIPSLGDKAGMKMMDIDDPNFTRREEANQSNWAETGGFLAKIPGAQATWGKTIGRGVRATNRAYVAFLNQLRADTFISLVRDAKAQFDAGVKGARNPYEDIPYAKQIADYVNTATGRGPMRISVLGEKETSFEESAKIFTDAMFSPKLFFAHARMLAPGTYINADSFVRKQYIRSLLSVAGAWGTVSGLAYMAGAEVSLDQNSADFGKIRIPGTNTRIDPAGGFQQYLVAASRLIGGRATSSATERPFELGVGYKADTRGDVAQRFLANKLHPVLKFAYDLLYASQYQPFHTADRSVQMFVPLVFQDVIELAKEDPKLLPWMGPVLLGMGTQTYGKGETGAQQQPGGPNYETKGKIIPQEYDYLFRGGALSNPFNSGSSGRGFGRPGFGQPGFGRPGF